MTIVNSWVIKAVREDTRRKNVDMWINVRRRGKDGANGLKKRSL
jgi:hypothetical protein